MANLSAPAARLRHHFEVTELVQLRSFDLWNSRLLQLLSVAQAAVFPAPWVSLEQVELILLVPHGSLALGHGQPIA